MKVIIAEKPSVAQGIASVVGARQRKDGYLTGDGYAVTWAFGHLVGLAMPESYGFSGFRREHLPILPQEFRLVPRQVRRVRCTRTIPEWSGSWKCSGSCSTGASPSSSPPTQVVRES